MLIGVALHMNYQKLASATLERRTALVDEAKRVSESTLPDAEKREKIENLNAQIEAATAEARDYIEQGERLAQVRSLSQGVGLFGPGGERRGDESEDWGAILPSASEYRAALATGNTGATVPSGVSSKVVEVLRGQSVFLRAPGLNVIPFSGGSFSLPQLTAWSDPGYTAEAATISQVLRRSRVFRSRRSSLRTFGTRLMSCFQTVPFRCDS